MWGPSASNDRRRHPRPPSARVPRVQVREGHDQVRPARCDRPGRLPRRPPGGGVLMGYTGPLADKDRIFTNVYGFQSPDLKAARQRGDWDDTKRLMAIGQDVIIDRIKASGLRGRGGDGFPTGMKLGFMPKEPKHGIPNFLVINSD